MSRRDPTRRTTRTGRLLDRVIQQRRDATVEARPDADEPDDRRQIAALEKRVEELEALLEAFQDSVHRETTRQRNELAALAKKIEAPEMARALGRYSQKRGL